MTQLSRFQPARGLTVVGLVAAFAATLAGAFAIKWTALFGVAILLMLVACVFALASFRPVIEVHDLYLAIGQRVIPWADVRQVQTTKWSSPLLLRLVLANRTTVTLFYPGDFASCDRLLRSIRHNAKWALLDGTPWHHYWHQPPQPLPGLKKKGAAAAAAPAATATAPVPASATSSATPAASSSHASIPVIRPEDEAEVERLYQLLKSVGHLDNSRQPADDK